MARSGISVYRQPGAFKTYYETGSFRRRNLKVHTEYHTTKVKAIRRACAISRRRSGVPGNYVGVRRKGQHFDIAACVKGKQVK